MTFLPVVAYMPGYLLPASQLSLSPKVGSIVTRRTWAYDGRIEIPNECKIKFIGIVKQIYVIPPVFATLIFQWACVSTNPLHDDHGAKRPKKYGPMTDYPRPQTFHGNSMSTTSVSVVDTESHTFG